MSESDVTKPKASRETDATDKRPYCTPRLKKLGQVNELTETIFKDSGYDYAPAPAAYTS